MIDEELMPVFTEPISDETAHALSEILGWLSITFDNTNYGQIRRHHNEMNEGNNGNLGFYPESKQSATTLLSHAESGKYNLIQCGINPFISPEIGRYDLTEIARDVIPDLTVFKLMHTVYL